MIRFKYLIEKTMEQRIKEHPAVQSYDKGHDEHFINLKPGYEWSGQRSFGDESISKVYKLLKQVTKAKGH
jgi:hypothetical protein